jgi:hypothetical protein
VVLTGHAGTSLRAIAAALGRRLGIDLFEHLPSELADAIDSASALLTPTRGLCGRIRCQGREPHHRDDREPHEPRACGAAAAWARASTYRCTARTAEPRGTTGKRCTFPPDAPRDHRRFGLPDQCLPE